MGWGEKAIEIRSVETGHLDGVFMHKRAQRLKFLCERNDKVGSPSPMPLSPLAEGMAMGSSWEGVLGSLPAFCHLQFLTPSCSVCQLPSPLTSASRVGGALRD